MVVSTTRYSVVFKLHGSFSITINEKFGGHKWWNLFSHTHLYNVVNSCTLPKISKHTANVVGIGLLRFMYLDHVPYTLPCRSWEYRCHHFHPTVMTEHTKHPKGNYSEKYFIRVTTQKIADRKFLTQHKEEQNYGRHTLHCLYTYETFCWKIRRRWIKLNSMYVLISQIEEKKIYNKRSTSLYKTPKWLLCQKAIDERNHSNGKRTESNSTRTQSKYIWFGHSSQFNRSSPSTKLQMKFMYTR